MTKDETLDRAIEYYAEHAKGTGGTAWMNPATVLETLALLRELKEARPAAHSWENYATAQDEPPAACAHDWRPEFGHLVCVKCAACKPA